MRVPEAIRYHLEMLVTHFKEAESDSFKAHVLAGHPPGQHHIWHALVIGHRVFYDPDPQSIVDEILRSKKGEDCPSEEPDIWGEHPGGGPVCLTPSQVAEFLHVGKATLANWRFRGVGPEYIKVGRSVLYERESIRKYIMSNMKRSTFDTD
jgi:hypothetical protein